ncbi:lipase family protein [Pseudalkalibacillus hwajinpoensis]|nr:lipase family protein [Pseudalkalibacillus hwajinpoensis]
MPKYNKKLALRLLYISQLTSYQYIHDGKVPSALLPKGFRWVKGFKANPLKNDKQKECFGFILQSDNSVVISFRGTKSCADWMADSEVAQLPFHGGYVHRGFLDIYNSCSTEIFKEYDKLTSPNKTLYVTGHSLGAGLATLHAVDAEIQKSFENIVLYNYASPRVGDMQFASIYKSHIKNSMRFVNKHDEIPKLPGKNTHRPPHTWEYEHVEPHITFKLRNHHYDLSFNHSFLAYRRGIKNLPFTFVQD